MLANALFCTIVLALAASAILSGGLAMTRAAIQRNAATFVAVGYDRAIQSLQNTLQTDMQNGGLPSPLPTVSPLPPQCADSECRYSTSERIQFTTKQLSAPAASCDRTQTNCASAEEGNAYVDESRVTARVTVTVSDASGTALVTKSSDATFRTLHRAPYVTTAGSRDGSFDGAGTDASSGDDGGVTAGSPDPCATASAGVSDDTTIRVQYRDTQNSACSDGSALRSQSYSQSPGSPAGWSP